MKLFFVKALAALSFVSLATASPVASPVTSRDASPALQGDFRQWCMSAYFTDHGPGYGLLQGTCFTRPANSEIFSIAVSTTLDLNLCLGNYNNHLDWGYKGGAFASCTGCQSRTNVTQYLDCDCGTIDLNEGIYVNEFGALSCYDQAGSAY